MEGWHAFVCGCYTSLDSFAVSTSGSEEDCYCQNHYIVFRITLASKVDIIN